jgi:hypothetical protein
MRYWLSFVILSWGCADGTNTPEDTDTSVVDTDTDTDTQDTEDTDEPTDVASVTGVVTLEDGSPLTSGNVRLCHGVCLSRTLGDDGAYEFLGASTGISSFEVVPVVDSGLATVFFPLILEVDDYREINVIVPELDSAQTLGASSQPLSCGEGLTVTVGASDLLTPVLSFDATAVAGVQVDPANWPPTESEEHVLPPCDDCPEVLGVWYMWPFDYHASAASGLPFSLENTWELEAGEMVEVFSGSYLDAEWDLVDTLTVDEDGNLVGTGEGLPLLSTLLVTHSPSDLK